MSDLLTGLASRHQFHTILPEMAAEAKPYRPLSLLLLKIRDFDLWQGQLNPVAADYLLQTTVDLISKHLPKEALAARWNDAIFAMLLPATPLWQAETLAEQLRDEVALAALPAVSGCQGLSFDFSYGMAACPPTEYSYMPGLAEQQLSHAEGGIFAELMLAAPPLPDTPTLNAYVHLAGRYMASGDPYLRRHGQMTESYALELARRLCLPQEQQDDLRLAAALADIAMAETAGAALHKPGPLTLAEYKRIQKHPLLAAQLCDSLSLPPRISEIILCHHEYWDGSGYPQGISGEDIPLPALILGISSAFSAMLLPRPYRPAKKLFAAKSALKSNQWPELIIRELRAII
jgi:HD-GYP domain-containing protein (c-di-GMP phosphodiesterase class II)